MDHDPTKHCHLNIFLSVIDAFYVITIHKWAHYIEPFFNQLNPLNIIQSPAAQKAMSADIRQLIESSKLSFGAKATEDSLIHPS